MQFASDVESMTCYQVLRLTRLCTPLKECDGQQCIMIAKKNSPTIRGLIYNISAVTDPILTKLCLPNFLGGLNLRVQVRSRQGQGNCKAR